MGKPLGDRPSPPSQRRDGRWFAYFRGRQIPLGKSEVDRRVRSKPTQEIEEAYARLLSRHAANPAFDSRLPNSATLEELIEDFLKSDESPRSKRQREHFFALADYFEDCFEGDPPDARDYDAEHHRELKDWLKSQTIDKEPRWSRGVMNSILQRVRRLLKYGKSRKICRADYVAEVCEVKGVRIGDATDHEPVLPAAWPDIEAALPAMPATVRALATVQVHCGARAGELVTMRASDVDTSDAVWCYRPAAHKTAGRGKSRSIHFGPKCRAALEPILAGLAAADFVFSPAREVAAQLALKSAARKTPRYPSHMKRNEAKRKDAARRKPGERYTTATYRRAMERACEAAGAAVFTPHRLRHRFITDVRGRFGLEYARIAAGHSARGMTERYSIEEETRISREIAEAMG